MPVITSRHPVRIAVENDRPLTLANNGDTIYYGPNENVSSSDTSIADDASATITRTSPVWVISAGTSDVSVTYPVPSVGPTVTTSEIADDAVTGAKILETTNIQVNNAEIDGALNHDGTTVGFYGTTPVTQQTGVAVTAGGVHAALVNLGLITA